MRLAGVLIDGVAWIAVDRGEGLEPVLTVAEFYADVDAGLERAACPPESDGHPRSYTVIPPVPATAKVLCAGLNYRAHASEAAMNLPSHPDVFGRWASTLVPTGTPVPIPLGEPGLDWEGELAVVIGRVLYQASPEEVEAAVVGYTCFNDLSARKHQLNTGQWTIGKNADRSGPIGPALVTRDEIGDPYQLRLSTRVDGETVQDARTSQMIFNIGEIGSYISECVTLNPGDVIATGTPEGIGAARKPPRYLQAGQLVEVEIDRIGVLVNPIVGARVSAAAELESEASRDAVHAY